MKFDWDKFKDAVNKIVVHCKTEEEAKDFCRQMDAHGMQWCIGTSYLEENEFSRYKEETCYSGDGTFSSYEYFIEYNYTVLEWSDYMKKEFTKADLKDGMFVICRNGEIRIKTGNILIRNMGWLSFNDYKEDLKDPDNDPLYDIVKVGYLKYGKGLNTVKEEDLDIIWERKEPQKITPEDAAKKLKELTGEDYEIV